MFNRELGVNAGDFARRSSSERNSSIAVNNVGGQKCRDAPLVASVSRRPAQIETPSGGTRGESREGGGKSEGRGGGVPIHFRLRGREASDAHQ